MNAKLPFVYLSSPPYSGSTLFSFLANSHPAIATVGEMTGPVASQDPARYACSCGEKIRECVFWRRVTLEMESRGFHFDPGHFDTRLLLADDARLQRVLAGSLRNSTLEDVRDALLALWPGRRRRLDDLVARNKALATSILGVTGRRIFFDASKSPMTIRHLAREPDIDLRVVHLVRDVRGASLSRRKNMGQTDWSGSVEAWLRTNRNIERQLRRLAPGRWIRVRYEDLCHEPAATMNRFFEFCGLQPHRLPEDMQAVEHHIVGNRMRLVNASQIKLDEGWRRTLTIAEQESASALAGPLMERYGYPRMTAADIIQAPAR